jgi:glucuronate isomerase
MPKYQYQIPNCLIIGIYDNARGTQWLIFLFSAYNQNMKTFMYENFLLETRTAESLYKAVETEPIYDYHCHLSPKLIAENHRHADIAEAWLAGDHYKWRIMRAMGIDERYITGSADGYEKFLRWARTAENLIGNPLCHWTHLELRRCFGINETLCEKTAPAIWEKANALLQKPELSVKGIFEKFNVYAVGTTDDPADSLEYHRAIAEGSAPIGKIKTRVTPSFRPDKALNINVKGFGAYVRSLSQAAGIFIESYEDLLAALEKRLDFFISSGCRSSDHGLEYVPRAGDSGELITKTFKDALAGKDISAKDADAYKAKTLIALANLYAKKGVVMQLHIGALRNVSAPHFSRLGPDTGNDACNDREVSGALASLLSLMESDGGLPKTVLYSLNPKDYYPLATVMGCFQDSRAEEEKREGVMGKMQLGAAWWFCDSRDGMEEQMRVLASVGMLPAFIGMLTDSRSFLSYTRHEYFRRVLCNLVGKWVENGEYPETPVPLEKIVRDISFRNAERYFG